MQGVALHGFQGATQVKRCERTPQASCIVVSCQNSVGTLDLAKRERIHLAHIVDVDECTLGIHGCPELCQNTVGSFKCIPDIITSEQSC